MEIFDKSKGLTGGNVNLEEMNSLRGDFTLVSFGLGLFGDIVENGDSFADFLS